VGGVGRDRRRVYNSGHTRVDVGGTYRLVNRYAFLQALDLTARIQNLLNEGDAEVRGFPALGINALVGLKASFWCRSSFSGRASRLRVLPRRLFEPHIDWASDRDLPLWLLDRRR
jgi:hypothetical protein